MTLRTEGGNKADRWPSLEIVKLGVGTITPLAIAVLGVVVNHSVRDRERSDREAAELRQQEDSRRGAVQGLSAALAQRRTRADLLASALRRDAPIDEVVERKRLYDEAYVQWGATQQASLLLRRLQMELKAPRWFGLLDSTLNGGILRPLDNCLTRAYDERRRGRAAGPVLDRCAATTLLRRAHFCSEALVDELFGAAGAFSFEKHKVPDDSAGVWLESRCGPRFPAPPSPKA